MWVGGYVEILHERAGLCVFHYENVIFLSKIWWNREKIVNIDIVDDSIRKFGCCTEVWSEFAIVLGLLSGTFRNKTLYIYKIINSKAIDLKNWRFHSFVLKFLKTSQEMSTLLLKFCTHFCKYFSRSFNNFFPLLHLP